MRRLIGGDFANIEGRINAWLAGEEWKIQAFEEYDAGTGEDLYKITAGRLTGIEPKLVTKAQRQAQGKVSELSLGYQGGVGAYVTMGDTYNVKPWDLTKPVKAMTPAAVWDKVQEKYSSAPDKHNLPEEQWTAIKIIVQRWREAHPRIVQSWWELGDAAVQAVYEPDTPVRVYNGRVAYLATGDWLYCQLPSGRVMSYCAPYIKDASEEMVNLPAGQCLVSQAHGDGWIPVDKFFDYEIDLLRAAGAEFWTRRKNVVRFMGMVEGKFWGEKYLYGGLQCENIVSGIARDCLDHAMLRVEEAGYPLVLTVHDELLSEPPEGFGSVQAFKDLMAVKPEWAEGLPMAVAAWEDARYVK